MNYQDLLYVLRWWITFFVIGLIFFPLTAKIFSNFFDKGYIFARILGMAAISYVVFVLGILKILPFTFSTIILVATFFLIINILIFRAYLKAVIPSLTGNRDSRLRGNDKRRLPWKIFLFEEIIFFITLFFWSYIHAHQPDIHGLEKYEDFGFINSILRSEYFPPADMWFTPLSINYYYFGHLVTAVLTKLSNIPSYITFNVMLATIFAFTFTGAFSIGSNLIEKIKNQSPIQSGTKIKIMFGGLLTAFIVSFAGNLHTIYTFFKPYVNENPVPFWQLAFSFNAFPNSYWYPNATRFIENTIHEFPLYSFVVSDLHAHVLDMPFVLLAIALLFSLLLRLNNHNDLQTQNYNSKLKAFISNSFAICDLRFAILLGFILAVMYMTNAWDGIIYFLLAALILLVIFIKQSQTSIMEIKNSKLKIKNSFQIEKPVLSLLKDFKLKIGRWLFYVSIVTIGSILFSLPFSLSFKPFASGIGIVCAPEFLTKIEEIVPFLFEGNHFQLSPWWQLLTL